MFSMIEYILWKYTKELENSTNTDLSKCFIILCMKLCFLSMTKENNSESVFHIQESCEQDSNSQWKLARKKKTQQNS